MTRPLVCSPAGDGADRGAPGNFVPPHDVTADCSGNVYVAEITWARGVSRGEVPEGTDLLQKFALIVTGRTQRWRAVRESHQRR